MQLRIENIGPIGSAHIDLTGLTIVGGLNDTGKSTIGKTLFAIVKAIRNREQEAIAAQRNRVNAIISELTSELRGIVGARLSPTNFSYSVVSILDKYIVSNAFAEREIVSLTDTLEEVRSFILREVERKTTVRNHTGHAPLLDSLNADREPANDGIITNFIARIRTLLSTRVDNNSVYFNSVNKTFRVSFRGEVNNKRIPDEIGVIALSDNDNEFLIAKFNNDKLTNLHVEENLVSSIFDDVTLLESPFALNNRPAFPYYPGGDDEPYPYSGDYSTHDLIQKLSFATKEVSASNLFTDDIASKIQETIQGRIYFDSDSDEFNFASNDGIEVKVNNTASGVKTLGILQMLARAGILSGTNLLIIDEPEVHLHPDWQIVYAEVIAILVRKYNIYCLVSSHSPYFMQAIEEYTRLYEMENLTKFYVSERNTKGLCIFKDVTENTTPLYDLLAEPMQRIAYLQTKKTGSSVNNSPDE